MMDVEKIRKEFPILKQKVNNHPLVYFDNGATTQKPFSVINSINNYYSSENSNVHRGVHYLSSLATKKLEETRVTVKNLIGAQHSSEIIFTKGTTDSINLVANAYRKLLNNGDEVIISELEHHSNIVPWQLCCEESGANLKVIPIKENGELDLSVFKTLITKKTKLVAVSHVSNSLGTINPIREIINQAQNAGAKVLIDGAQAASHIEIDVCSLNVDFYCFSAHKLYGPTGVGVLYGKKQLLQKIPVYQGGGEMIKEVTLQKTTFAELPHKFEAGTPNISAIIAFNQAINFVTELGINNIELHEKKLLKYCTDELKKINGLKIYGTAKDKTAIISFNISNIHPYDIGVILDKMGVAIRTGHHCTQPVMNKYKIPGTARISFAIYNTKEEVDICIKAIKKAIIMLS
jgi:cysteine desulfurase/selenocysteine lyase